MNEVLLIQTFKKCFEEHKNGVLTKIRLKNNGSRRKSWEGISLQKDITYKNGITESWLKQNFKKHHLPFYKAVTIEEDEWYRVSVGGKIDVMGLKKE